VLDTNGKTFTQELENNLRCVQHSLDRDKAKNKGPHIICGTTKHMNVIDHIVLRVKCNGTGLRESTRVVHTGSAIDHTLQGIAVVADKDLNRRVKVGARGARGGLQYQTPAAAASLSTPT
jgi:hypothetical protein